MGARINYEDASKYWRRQSDETLLNPTHFDIQELHRVLFTRPDPTEGFDVNSAAGVFKNSKTYIRVGERRFIQHSLPEEVQPHLKELHELSDSLLKSANISSTPNDNEYLRRIEFVAYYHARFIQIHPFMDGNGRTSRMIAFEQMRILYPNFTADTEWINSGPKNEFNGFGKIKYLGAMDKAHENLFFLARYFSGPNAPEIPFPLVPPRKLTRKISNSP